MRFDAFVDLVGSLPCFDLATVVQLTGEPRQSVTNQLWRWCQAEKLIPLRRGMYTLADRYRRVPLSPAVLANTLYHPSYLSDVWALSHFGLIPESVPSWTCVTTRKTKTFTNPVGRFVYHNVKQDFFFGYQALPIAGDDIIVATAEKALLDFFHLRPGEWTKARIAEMRFQQTDIVDRPALRNMAARMGKPRLLRAVDVWQQVCDETDEGSIEL